MIKGQGLTHAELNIEGVVGLDPDPLKLLKPNGAIGEPAGDRVVEVVK